ncbi:DNA-binding response regulator [Aphanothece hegewaldii CCALA 016]|uniref:DNA-binding response regulator n=1 Tax=Aphanothece hegewaldii CCALA 016 TaxID=2107694 RepID=A0A2T1M3T2_9CHRO|nr:response regulator transcription factor [Aphanothece hegewaldii]PSF39478.1 DNA-binding response regulator [Aphanothece hegewaldii CCALA 016]
MDKIRIIVIEDHELTRIGLIGALQRRDGIQVVGEASNGIQGLRLLESVKPDVALVDIGLPDIDGIELVRRFKAGVTEETPVIKILMLTMHRSQDSVLAAFAAGADSYCMKDVSVDKLADAIRLTQEGNPWIDPSIANIILQQVRQAAPNGETPLISKQISINAVDADYQKLLKDDPLTERELEILDLIVGGCSNADIAAKLYITVGTVKTHVRNILNKLGADDRTQAAVRALRSGLIH